MARKSALPDRIAAKIDDSGDCWIWTAAVDRHGYGAVGNAGKVHRAHRLIWEIFNGPVPKPPPGVEHTRARLHLDHLCRVPRCVNPDHLEPVTHAENLARGAAVRETCEAGHRWDEGDNERRLVCGGRRCRACVRIRQGGL